MQDGQPTTTIFSLSNIILVERGMNLSFEKEFDSWDWGQFWSMYNRVWFWWKIRRFKFSESNLKIIYWIPKLDNIFDTPRILDTPCLLN